MYYAIGNKITRKLIEVTTNEQSSLDGMQAYLSLGYDIVRFAVDEKVFIEYSNGLDHTIETNYYTKLIDGKKCDRFKTVAVLT